MFHVRSVACDLVVNKLTRRQKEDLRHNLAKPLLKH